MLTGFAGRMNLNNCRATIDEARQLSAVMPVPKGSKISVEALGPLALAVGNPPYLFNLKKKPILTDHKDFLFTGSGSLYNREKLILELNCGKDTDDLDLMFFSWQKWGRDAPAHLDGDWMFAAYDCQRDEGLLARSWGYSSLYYYQGNDFLVFATHPAALSALSDVASQPDIQVITQLLCFQALKPSASGYLNILQLKPGAALVVTKKEVREAAFWQPADIPKSPVRNQEIAINEFISLYQSAVHKRLRTPMEIGATLSAGLDSSSVCILAAHDLHQAHKNLYAWTSVPHYPEEAIANAGWLKDERKLASEVIKDMENASHSNIDAGDADPIEAIRRQIVRTGRPQSAVKNLFWIDRILELAHDSGCGVLLIGQAGNNTVSWSPYQIKLFPKSNFFPETSWSKYARLLKKKMYWLVKKNIKEFRQRFGYGYSPLLNPHFKQSEDFNKAMRNTGGHTVLNQAAFTEMNMPYFDIWYHNSFWNGIEVRDPTLDLKLVEFLLAIPENMFFRDGMDRRVMRLGMKGILPDEIRLNKSRGQQASDIVPRVRHFSEQAAKALACIEKSGLAKEILDIQLMDQILKRINNYEAGLSITRDCSAILLPGLSVGLYLASFDTELDLTKPLAELG